MTPCSGRRSPSAWHGRAAASRSGTFDDFRIEPEQILEDDDRLIALVHQSGTGRASGIEVEVPIAHVWTVKDGQAVRWQSYASREEALADSAAS